MDKLSSLFTKWFLARWPADNIVEVGILISTIVATAVVLLPIVSYITVSWGWRRQAIINSLSIAAKDKYLHLYHRQQPHASDADLRFQRFYQQWFRRSRLISPAVLVVVITIFYAFLMSCYVAQQLQPNHSLIDITSTAQSSGVIHAIGIAAAAIAGAYVLVSLDAIDRVVRRDLSPEDLYVQALRLMACVPVSYALSSWAPGQSAMIIAFGVAGFPLQLTQKIIQKVVLRWLKYDYVGVDANDPVTKLSGVDNMVFERMTGIGVYTIGQLAESDPVQLAMRTNLNFSYLLDLTSQAIAWNYLGDKLTLLRPMGLRGACELRKLSAESQVAQGEFHENANNLIAQTAVVAGLTVEQFGNVLHLIYDDPYTEFLFEASGDPLN